MRVALVGCGNIAARYAERVTDSPLLELVGAFDALPGRAEEFVAEHGGASYSSLDALLADDRIELVVNLTAPSAHAVVTRAALEAGKHVHTEKPLALAYDEARELVDLAAAREVVLGCSPATLLGEAQQTAWKLVREGAIGTVRAVYAEANWGRIERWHPSPSGLYEVGAFVDVGVYPLTIVTAMLGPAKRVLAYGTVLEPERVTRSGASFHVETPDLVVAVVELESGVAVRLTASFYVGPGKQQGTLELHGDVGSLHIGNWQEFDSGVELALDGQPYEPVPYLRPPYRGTDWGRALEDIVDAVARERPPRASGGHAAHVVEVLGAIRESFERGGTVPVLSSFEPPPPLEWAQ
jgi:predicted dehydrogenase